MGVQSGEAPFGKPVIMSEKTMLPLLMAASVCVSAAIPAWAAEPTAGRITYIDPVGRRLMLDNAYMYRLGPDVDLSKLAVADRAKLRVEKRDGGEIVTQVTVQP
jgi:hypothetical protein